MENLSATLIRSSEELSGEWVGYLADSWKVEQDRAIFQLKPDLKWSDGSSLRCEEIVSHFENLKIHPHRHLQAIKKIKSISCQPDRSEVTFIFEGKPPVSFFHELTLADTGLIKKLNGPQSWSITSGPYFVSGVDADRKEVRLSKNPHSSMVLQKGTPERVLLREIPFQLEHPLDSKIPAAVDYVAPQGWSFLPKVTRILDQAPKKIEGRPSLVHFISFLHATDEVRNAIQTAVRKTNSQTSLIPSNTMPYSEVIPPGYNGYLNLPESKEFAEETKKLDTTLTLVIRPQYEALSAWLEKLKSEAEKLGVKMVYEFGDITNPELGKRKGHVALLGVFKGNMKDPAGSWSFLSDPSHGALRGYVSMIQPFLNNAVAATDPEVKARILSDLHRQVLEKKVIIPLWCERMFMIHNERVSSIRANPFDFRIHFYEVRMNES